MTKFGYTRVVSEHQSAKNQVQQLEGLGINSFYQEHASGVSQTYPEREQLLQNVEAGDEIYVTELSKLVRSTIDLCNVILHIRKKGALLYSLEESWLDFSEHNPQNDYFLNIIEKLYQLENDIDRKRRQEGIEAAKQEGKYQGRKKTYDEHHPGMNHAIELYQEGHYTVQHICEITQISRSSLYRELKRRS